MQFNEYVRALEKLTSDALDRICLTYTGNRVQYTPPSPKQEAEILASILFWARQVKPGEGLSVLRSDVTQAIEDYKDFKALKYGKIPRFEKRIKEPHEQIF